MWVEKIANQIFTFKSKWSRIFPPFNKVVCVSRQKCISFCPEKTPNAQAGEVYRTLIAAPANQDWASSVALLSLKTGQGLFWRFLSLCRCCGGWSWTGKKTSKSDDNGRRKRNPTSLSDSRFFAKQVGSKTLFCVHNESVLGQEVRNPDPQ